MTLPRSVAEVLSDHVVFEIESIDRMYLNVYQPRLQYGGGVSAFFVGHRGHKYASSVLMQPITEFFVANIHHYIAAHDLDLVSFGKGEDKDAKAGIGFQPLDNAFAAVDDVPALQAICDSLGEPQIQALLAKWLRILPHPFTEEDIAAGYRYDGSSNLTGDPSPKAGYTA
jgi:hypothetical protein